ncbi:uncharacterized protein LOC143147310 [Ptiloglossa arizonensis]|uniref:uncharacterized protein LOC143147310 n=1 Tax=Ptiloglossa arizonensis TaxID=3350558 RepID=UPI003F9EDA7D
MSKKRSEVRYPWHAKVYRFGSPVKDTRGPVGSRSTERCVSDSRAQIHCNAFRLGMRALACARWQFVSARAFRCAPARSVSLSKSTLFEYLNNTLRHALHQQRTCFPTKTSCAPSSTVQWQWDVGLESLEETTTGNLESVTRNRALPIGMDHYARGLARHEEPKFDDCVRSHTKTLLPRWQLVHVRGNLLRCVFSLPIQT